MNCKVCGSSERKKVYMNSFFGRLIDVFQCGNCGLVVVDCYDESFIDQYYADSYTMHERLSSTNMLKKRIMHAISRTLINMAERRRVRMLKPYLQRGATNTLDVGCTEGDFVIAMKKWGDACGTEMTKSLADIARSKGVTVLGGKITDIDPARRFSPITYFHVLEHLVDPVRQLIDTRSYLFNGGYIVCEVPYTKNVDTLTESAKGLYFNDVHLNHFNERSFAALAERAGYRVVDMRILKFKKTIARRLYDDANPHYLHPSFSAIYHASVSKTNKAFSSIAALELFLRYLLGQDVFVSYPLPLPKKFRPDYTQELFTVLQDNG